MRKDDITIIYKNIKHSYLKIRPTGEVVFTTPMSMSDKEINHILAKRSQWIHKHLESFSTHTSPPKELVSGESLAYLGEDYRLKVIKSDREKIELTKNYLNLYTTDTDNYNKKEALLLSWYKERAGKIFSKSRRKIQSHCQEKNTHSAN